MCKNFLQNLYYSCASLYMRILFCAFYFYYSPSLLNLLPHYIIFLFCFMYRWCQALKCCVNSDISDFTQRSYLEKINKKNVCSIMRYQSLFYLSSAAINQVYTCIHFNINNMTNVPYLHLLIPHMGPARKFHCNKGR